MTSHSTLAGARAASALLALAVVLTNLGGCPGITIIPDTLDVSISATEKVSAERDSGPPNLADSSWAVFRVADPNDPDDEPDADAPPPGPYGGLLNGGLIARPPIGEQIFIVDFGAGGVATGVRENRFFLPEFYGSEVPIRSTWTPTTIPGVLYRSASFGVEVDGRFGAAIFVEVRFAGLLVGQAVLYAWGTRDDAELNGTFGYLLDFTDGIGRVLLLTGGDQYPFRAELVFDTQ